MLLTATVAEGEIVSSQNLWDFLAAGGPIMVPIAICSVVAMTYGLERLLHLTRGRVIPNSMPPIIDAVQQGRIQDAGKEVAGVDAPAARILHAGLRRHGRALQDVERAMEDQGRKEIERLRNNVRPLQLIAGVAPLLGLLGTVMGIQDSFHLVVRTGMGKPEHLAGGIEEALVTTIAGLCVAIPALLMAAYLNHRIRRLVASTDDLLTPLVEQLAQPPRERHAA